MASHKKTLYPWSPEILNGYREAIRKLDEISTWGLLEAPEPIRSRSIKRAQDKLLDIVWKYKVSKGDMQYFANWLAEHATKGTTTQHEQVFKVIDDVKRARDEATRRVALLTIDAPVLDHLALLDELILRLETNRDNDDLVVALSSLARALRREPTVENHVPTARFIAEVENNIIPELRDSDLRLPILGDWDDVRQGRMAELSMAKVFETGLDLYKQTATRP